MTKKDKWLEETMNSLDGIKKAIPSDDLLSRIMMQIPKPSSMPKWQLRLTAVAASLLIAVNIFVLDYNKQQVNSQITEEYVTLNEDYSLYK